jgi:hypothetical protein
MTVLQPCHGLQYDHDPLIVSAELPIAGVPGMSFASTDPAVFLALVVSVPVDRNLEVGGSYVDDTESGQAMVVREAGSVWGQARELALPSGATDHTDEQAASLNGLDCTSVDNCVAIGTYADTHGARDYQAMAADATNAVWQRASRLPLPADANTAAGQQKASLNAITCTGPGSCVAVGYYTDADGRQDYQGLVETWHR